MTLAREAIKLGSTTYGDHTATPVSGLQQSVMPPMNRTIIQHECPLALSWPQKDLGPIPPTITGTILLYETAVHAFLADVAVGTAERKLYWVDSGVEVYAWVRSGVAQRVRWGEGFSSQWQWVTFTFIATKTAVYKASDDSVLWGGS
jgi:hypothetical protein